MSVRKFSYISSWKSNFWRKNNFFAKKCIFEGSFDFLFSSSAVFRTLKLLNRWHPKFWKWNSYSDCKFLLFQIFLKRQFSMKNHNVFFKKCILKGSFGFLYVRSFCHFCGTDFFYRGTHLQKYMFKKFMKCYENS